MSSRVRESRARPVAVPRSESFMLVIYYEMRSLSRPVAACERLRVIFFDQVKAVPCAHEYCGQWLNAAQALDAKSHG